MNLVRNWWRARQRVKLIDRRWELWNSRFALASGLLSWKPSDRAHLEKQIARVEQKLERLGEADG